MTCGCNETTVTAPTTIQTEVDIEFLFLDEDVCVPCGGTSKSLERAVELLSEPLAELGVSLNVRKIHIADEKTAIAEKFLSSPTIRINGKDIDETRTEDDCPTCGDLAGGKTPVTCRTWHWRGDVYSEAPVGKIIEEVMLAATQHHHLSAKGDNVLEGEYVLPENLRGFFAARTEGQKSCC